MNAKIFQKLQPIKYYNIFLSKTIRPDGRNFTDIRDTVVSNGSINTSSGSSLVKIGNTIIICGLRLEVGVPNHIKPSNGFLEIDVNLSPMCSNNFKIGSITEKEQTVSTLLYKIITNSKLFNFDELCIVKGKYVWHIYCDIVCLDYDGNVIDASCLAITKALKNLKIPDSKINKHDELICSKKNYTKLNIGVYPVSTTFAFVQDKILCDPTDEEEKLSKGQFTIVYNTDGSLVSIDKPGGSRISLQKLKECMKISKDRTVSIKKLVKNEKTKKKKK